MDKKDLKFYVAPSQEVVELDAKTALLSGSTGSSESGAEGITVETGGDDQSGLFD